MKKYFVIGNPIDHSFSPKLHNYWLKENNIDAIYDKKKIEEKDLKKTTKKCPVCEEENSKDAVICSSCSFEFPQKKSRFKKNGDLFFRSFISRIEVIENFDPKKKETWLQLSPRISKIF